MQANPCSTNRPVKDSLRRFDWQVSSSQLLSGHQKILFFQVPRKAKHKETRCAVAVNSCIDHVISRLKRYSLQSRNHDAQVQLGFGVGSDSATERTNRLRSGLSVKAETEGSVKPVIILHQLETGSDDGMSSSSAAPVRSLPHLPPPSLSLKVTPESYS